MSVSFDPELEEVARAADRPTYNTAAVEQRTGLRPATFRAWERRYGFPKPRRLPGNQRLYSDQDIAAIRWLQRRTEEGLSISHAIRLLRERLQTGLLSAPSRETGRPVGALADDLMRALIGFDSAAAELVLSEAFAMHPVEDVCLGVIEPALVEVGERWHRGELSVAAEHFATSLLRRKLFALYNVYETGRGRGLIFTACAPEEWHEVGVLMVSLFLVRHGFRVSYLGANLPAAGLAETLARQQPDLLLISASLPETAERIVEIGAVIQALPAPRPILGYGGRGFDDEALRRRLPGTYLGADAAAAVWGVEELLGAGRNGAGH